MEGVGFIRSSPLAMDGVAPTLQLDRRIPVLQIPPQKLKKPCKGSAGHLLPLAVPALHAYAAVGIREVSTVSAPCEVVNPAGGACAAALDEPRALQGEWGASAVQDATMV